MLSRTSLEIAIKIRKVNRLNNFDSLTDLFYVSFAVMNYLRTKKRTVAPHTPRVVLLGPTGSGKSVQASLLASKYQLINGKDLKFSSFFPSVQPFSLLRLIQSLRVIQRKTLQSLAGERATNNNRKFPRTPKLCPISIVL